MSVVSDELPQDIPEFMQPHLHSWLNRQMIDDPEFFPMIAKYAGNDLTDDAMVHLLRETHALTTLKDGIVNIAHWKADVSSYPSGPMPKGRLSKTENPELPFRALFVFESISKLLDCVGAPPAIKSDFAMLVRKHLPSVAQKRADVQALLIEHPDWTDYRIAKEAKYDLTRLRSEIDGGLLKRRPQQDASDEP